MEWKYGATYQSIAFGCKLSGCTDRGTTQGRGARPQRIGTGVPRHIPPTRVMSLIFFIDRTTSIIMSTRCRGWFFTCWNVDPLAEWINSPNEKPYDSTLEWCHWQIEQCPTTGRLHAQGACWFSNARTRDGVQKYFHESPQTMYYCEPIASLSGAHAYCAKEETRVTGPGRMASFLRISDVAIVQT